MGEIARLPPREVKRILATVSLCSMQAVLWQKCGHACQRSLQKPKEGLPGEDRRLCFLLFAFLWMSFAWIYRTGAHNDNAHFNQIRAWPTA